MSTLSTKKEYIAGQITSGTPYNEIAAEHNVTKSAISKFKNRNQDLIEEQANKYLKALPDIIGRDLNEIKEAKDLSKNLINLLKTAPDKLKQDELMSLLDEKKIAYISKFLERIDKKETDIKRSVGILNSNTPAMVFQSMNIYNDNRTELSPQLLSLLSGKMDDLTVIECDIEDAECKDDV